MIIFVFLVGTGFIEEYETILTALDAALGAGYRSFDIYPSINNESNVGRAFEELLPKHGLTRRDIYLITKIPPECYEKVRTSECVYTCLSNLRTTYIDFCLLLWPGSRDLDPSDCIHPEIRTKAWNNLIDLQEEGYIRHMGVCNFSCNQLKSLLTECIRIRPILLQVEIHPRFPQKDLLAAAEEFNILVQSLCIQDCFHKRMLSDSSVLRVAKSIRRTPTQVILKWILNKGAAVIVNSQDPDSIYENYQLFDFVLEKMEMQILDSIHLREKYEINTVPMS